jgi:hypothetical protein
MSLQRPRGQGEIVVSCGFGQSTSTTNLERTICGLIFVIRFVTFSKRRILRTDICSEVVELLDKQDIQFSSVDLVRFSWVEEDEDIEDVDILKTLDVGIKVAPCGTVTTTPVTIWVGVLPNTLTGDVAFHSSNDILGLLKEHGITDFDVAYRESVVRDLSGPELFAPVSDFDPLKAIIDPVTTALGLPIAGLKTLKTEGTMGFYFRAGEDFYAVTARHVLFPKDEGNKLYTYVGMFFSTGRMSAILTTPTKPGLRRRLSSWAPDLSTNSTHPSWVVLVT